MRIFLSGNIGEDDDRGRNDRGPLDSLFILIVKLTAQPLLRHLLKFDDALR